MLLRAPLPFFSRPIEYAAALGLRLDGCAPNDGGSRTSSGALAVASPAAELLKERVAVEKRPLIGKDACEKDAVTPEHAERLKPSAASGKYSPGPGAFMESLEPKTMELWGSLPKRADVPNPVSPVLIGASNDPIASSSPACWASVGTHRARKLWDR